ncbi:MAG: diaminopimelate epimerase [Xanthomonadales bacterium]|nr:diaminopimelate epimerase [Xanthomonadales bacterium]
MPVRFHKMHGAGNDFVLLDLREQSLDMDAEKARSLAERRTGVGCDQVLVLHPPGNPDHVARFEVWNADGSKAQQCGNGVRCIGLYLHANGEAPGARFVIGGPVAPIEMEMAGEGQVRVNMGVPDFRPEAVPIALTPAEQAYRLPIDGQEYTLGAVSMGNPHALIQVPDIEAAPVGALGPKISTHAAFPEGCNAGFAEILDRGAIELRVFERGSGETRACGSGACAAAAILIRNGSLDTQVLVKQVGGELIIDWTGDGHSLMMTGPAVHVYEGILL